MSTIADKLIYLSETKDKIKEAINNKGVSVSDDDTFRSYADRIGEIETGGLVGKLIEKTITKNGTYRAEDENKNTGVESGKENTGIENEKETTDVENEKEKIIGYSKIIVNVKSSGGVLIADLGVPTAIIISPVLISDDIATTA